MDRRDRDRAGPGLGSRAGPGNGLGRGPGGARERTGPRTGGARRGISKARVGESVGFHVQINLH